ncbi:MAG: hypothetical protein H6673_07290 [Anaerolineales bacterium]|nr:hypothetical protein [Anaerolineales bacterium]
MDNSFFVNHLTIGNGRVNRMDNGYSLTIGVCTAQGYHDAQITDYTPGALPRNYQFRPPLRLHLRAWYSHPAEQLRGTAGFGFWNQPILPSARSLRLPRALWFFFGSLPNNMALAKDVAGHGWKAATFDAQRWPFFALAPLAPLGFALMRISTLYRRLWPIGQRAIGVSETALTFDLTQPHDYIIDWQLSHADFYVDGSLVHHARQVPRVPLGFIAWIDNQYAVVTPQGRFGFGRLALEHDQSLFIEDLRIQPEE